MSEMVVTQKRKSRLARELNAVITIMARDITLFFKSPGTIIMSLAMPVVMMGMLSTLVVGAFMGIMLPGYQLLLILALSPLICLSAGALAMIIIGLVKSNKMANMAVMLITMPQMFLSGAIIPIGNSSGILLVISRMMPMTYCLDLVRAVVYAGTPEYASVVLFNPALSLAVVVGITVVCMVVGTFYFARSEKNR